MWNHEIKLISKKVTGKDKLLQPISEFYQANKAGLKPSLVVEIRSFEYENQEFAKFEGKQYRILKTHPIDSEILELTLSEVLK